MRVALKGAPEKRFDMPAGVVTARIDPESGQLVSGDAEHSMLEVFRAEDVARLASNPNTPTEDEKKVQQEAYGIF
jgi:penicillin-binding protein 1A